MSVLLICLFLSVGFISDFPKNRNKTDLIDLNLKGKAKSLRETSYYVKDSSGIAVRNGRIYVDKINRLTLFNVLGNITQRYEYGFSDNLDSKDTLIYDSFGNLKEIDLYDPDEDDTIPKDKQHKIKYKTNGVFVDVNYFYLGSLTDKWKYKYDTMGNVLEENHYEYNNKSPTNGYAYQYDNKGNCIEQSDLTQNDFSANMNVDLKYKYVYDNIGNEVESDTYSSSDVLYNKNLNYYDIQGNLIRNDIIYAPDSLILVSKTYKYFYDANGNWTSKIEFKNDVPNFWIDRKIEYYP